MSEENTNNMPSDGQNGAVPDVNAGANGSGGDAVGGQADHAAVPSTGLPDLANYGMALFEGVEQGSLDYQLYERARVAAHKAGVSEEALSAVMGDVRAWTHETEAAIERDRLAASDEQLKELKQTYGVKFNAVMEACNNTLQNLAAELGFDAGVFNTPELRNNPEVIKLFYGIHDKLKEAGFAGLDKMASVATAEQELQQFRDGTHPLSADYRNSTSAGFARASARVDELMAQVYGNK